MYQFELSFCPKDFSDEFEAALTDFLNSIMQNGFIYQQDLRPVYASSLCIVRVTAPEKQFVDIQRLDRLGLLDELKEYLVRMPKLQYIGRVMGAEPICSCENPSHYILFTMHGQMESPVLCGDCMKEVPLYRLPKTYEVTDYRDVLDWAKVYQCCDEEFMVGFSERHAFKMMSDYNSNLTTEGLRICSKWEELTGKPFYYFLFKYYSNPKKVCPKCGMPWENNNPKFQYDFVCHDCKLVSNLI